MSHEIMGNRFIARSKPAWHNIARRIFGESERITAREAMVEVAGDIEFARGRVYADVAGTQVEIPKQTAIFRKPTSDDPTMKYLGLATQSWALDSYPDLAAMLDGLPGNGYPVETAGVMEQAARAFLCFRGEDWQVKGDEMRSYFAATFSGTPGVSHKVLHSPVRVVCWNTEQMADQQASINLAIPHSADAKARISLAATLVTRFVEMKDKARDIFTAFADTQVTQQDVDSIVYAAFQLPELPAKLRFIKQQLTETESEVFKRALDATLLAQLATEQERWERQCEQVTKLRETAQERFEAFEPAHLRGTAWAAYNAVTEVSDWREGRNADESALFGGRAKEKGRAYAAAMALVK